MEDRSTMPAGGSIATDRAILDGHIAERADSSAHIARGVAADRTAGDGGSGVEEGVETTA